MDDVTVLESRSSKREFLVEAAWEQGAGSREQGEGESIDFSFFNLLTFINGPAL
jgi:hypothetical protein